VIGQLDPRLKNVAWGAGFELGFHFADYALWIGMNNSGMNPNVSLPWFYADPFLQIRYNVWGEAVGLPAILYLLGHFRRSQRFKDMAYGAGAVGIFNLLEHVFSNISAGILGPPGQGFTVDWSFPTTNVLHGRPGPSYATRAEQLPWQTDLTW
jgi:hypothetical protein